MQLLGLLGMYFDAVVVEVEKYLLFFRLALAILCLWVSVVRAAAAHHMKAVFCRQFSSHVLKPDAES